MQERLVPDESDHQKRADIFVAENLLEGNRSRAKKLFSNGQVADEEGNELRPSDKANKTIFVQLENPEIKPIDIPIIFEDDDVIVIDKPEGVIVHSQTEEETEYSVVSFLRDKTTDKSRGREGIVHRLDRATSGVMIAAKSSKARVMLQKQFARRTVQKQYIALVEGEVTPDKQRLEWPIERNPKKPSTYRVGINGKPAATIVEVDKSDGEKTLLRLKLETGRTHQLRVHLQHLGHPIIGDFLYGGAEADRLMLHAQSLQITVPSGENMTFESNLPEEFSL